MQDRKYAVVSCGDFETQYDAHLVRVRGLSQSTRKVHRLVVHKLLTTAFPSGRIVWSDFRFQDVVRFVTGEFRRLHNRETQRTWLMVLRMCCVFGTGRTDRRRLGRRIASDCQPTTCAIAARTDGR